MQDNLLLELFNATTAITRHDDPSTVQKQSNTNLPSFHALQYLASLSAEKPKEQVPCKTDAPVQVQILPNMIRGPCTPLDGTFPIHDILFSLVYKCRHMNSSITDVKQGRRPLISNKDFEAMMKTTENELAKEKQFDSLNSFHDVKPCRFVPLVGYLVTTFFSQRKIKTITFVYQGKTIEEIRKQNPNSRVDPVCSGNNRLHFILMDRKEKLPCSKRPRTDISPYVVRYHAKVYVHEWSDYSAALAMHESAILEHLAENVRSLMFSNNTVCWEHENRVPLLVHMKQEIETTTLIMQHGLSGLDSSAANSTPQNNWKNCTQMLQWLKQACCTVAFVHGLGVAHHQMQFHHFVSVPNPFSLVDNRSNGSMVSSRQQKILDMESRLMLVDFKLAKIFSPHLNDSSLKTKLFPLFILETEDQLKEAQATDIAALGDLVISRLFVGSKNSVTLNQMEIISEFKGGLLVTLLLRQMTRAVAQDRPTAGQCVERIDQILKL